MAALFSARIVVLLTFTELLTRLSLLGLGGLLLCSVLLFLDFLLLLRLTVLEGVRDIVVLPLNAAGKYFVATVGLDHNSFTNGYNGACWFFTDSRKGHPNVEGHALLHDVLVLRVYGQGPLLVIEADSEAEIGGDRQVSVALHNQVFGGHVGTLDWLTHLEVVDEGVERVVRDDVRVFLLVSWVN